MVVWVTAFDLSLGQVFQNPRGDGMAELHDYRHLHIDRSER